MQGERGKENTNTLCRVCSDTLRRSSMYVNLIRKAIHGISQQNTQP